MGIHEVNLSGWEQGKVYRDGNERSDSVKVIYYLPEWPLTLEEDSCKWNKLIYEYRTIKFVHTQSLWSLIMIISSK
jgi:hypothetical protein